MTKDIPAIEWETPRQVDYTVRHFIEARKNLVRSIIELMGEEVSNEPTRYDPFFLKMENGVILNELEYPTETLLDDSIVIAYGNFLDGEFPIPYPVHDYIVEMFDSGYLSEANFTLDPMILDKGKEIVEMCVEASIPQYSALAVTGAFYVECGWRPKGAVNTTEMYQKKGAAQNTGGWSGAGEGLFGLTFWDQKLQIMRDPAIMPIILSAGIPLSQGEYNSSSRAHLSNLDTKEWMEIFKVYLRIKGKDYVDILLDESAVDSGDEQVLMNVLAASYLFKAGNFGNGINWESAMKTSTIYRNTHADQNGANSVHDGLAQQIMISYILSLHIQEKLPKSFSEVMNEFKNI